MADRQFLTKLRHPRVSATPTGGNDGDLALYGDTLYDNNSGTWSPVNIAYQNLYNGLVRPKVWTYAQVTDGNGLATFIPPTGYFTTVHVASPAVIQNDAGLYGCYLKTQTTTSITVQTYKSNSTGILLGGTAIGLVALGSGFTVNLVVFGV